MEPNDTDQQSIWESVDAGRQSGEQRQQRRGTPKANPEFGRKRNWAASDETEESSGSDAAPLRDPQLWHQLRANGMSCMVRFFTVLEGDDANDLLLKDAANARDTIALQLRVIIGKKSEEYCRMVELQHMLHGVVARLELAVEARETQARVRTDCMKTSCVLKLARNHRTLIDGKIHGGACRLIMPARDVMDILNNGLNWIPYMETELSGRLDQTCIAQDLLRVVPHSTWKILKSDGPTDFIIPKGDDRFWLQALEFDRPTGLSSERYQFTNCTLSGWPAKIETFKKAVERSSQHAFATRSADCDARVPQDMEMVARNPAEQTCLQMRFSCLYNLLIV